MSTKFRYNINKKGHDFIEEVSALSGIQKGLVQEIIEFMVVRWAEEIAKNPDKLAELYVPGLGSVSCKYEGDEELPNGELKTNVLQFVSLDDQFKKLIGDIHDEGESVVTNLLRRKIEQAILVNSGGGLSDN
jgi:hypothetical protein